MTNTVSFLGLLCGVITVSGSDFTCIDNTTCVHYEVCRDTECWCPGSYYGANCEFSIINALVIVVICTLPPVSWLAVCCYGIHSKGSSRLWHSRQRGSNNEPERDVEEDIIEDQPPPSYAQILQYNTAGTVEGVNMMIEGPDSQDMEPPPSYQEWTRKAATLRKQEIRCGGGIGLVTISDNTQVPSHVISEDVESEDQC